MGIVSPLYKMYCVFTGAGTPPKITAQFSPLSFSFGEIRKKTKLSNCLFQKIYLPIRIIICFLSLEKTLTSFAKSGICSLSGMTLKIQCTKCQKTRGNKSDKEGGCGSRSLSVSLLVAQSRVRELHVKC